MDNLSKSVKCLIPFRLKQNETGMRSFNSICNYIIKAPKTILPINKMKNNLNLVFLFMLRKILMYTHFWLLTGVKVLITGMYHCQLRSKAYPTEKV